MTRIILEALTRNKALSEQSIKELNLEQTIRRLATLAYYTLGGEISQRISLPQPDSITASQLKEQYDHLQRCLRIIYSTYRPSVNSCQTLKPSGAILLHLLTRNFRGERNTNIPSYEFDQHQYPLEPSRRSCLPSDRDVLYHFTARLLKIATQPSDPRQLQVFQPLISQGINPLPDLPPNAQLTGVQLPSAYDFDTYLLITQAPKQNSVVETIFLNHRGFILTDARIPPLSINSFS